MLLDHAAMAQQALQHGVHQRRLPLHPRSSGMLAAACAQLWCIHRQEATKGQTACQKQKHNVQYVVGWC
jgi:hypothetical protein